MVGFGGPSRMGAQEDTPLNPRAGGQTSQGKEMQKKPHIQSNTLRNNFPLLKKKKKNL